MSLGPAFKGARLLDSQMTPIDIWQLVHSNAREWLQVPRNSNFFRIREMLDDADREALAKLSDLAPDIWEHLCYGAGWTILGAVGLSWCHEACFDRVAASWLHVAPAVGADEFTIRAASLLRPGLLPSCGTLRQVCEEMKFDAFKISLVLAAQHSSVEIDLERDELLAAPAILIPALKFTLERSKRGEDFRDIVNGWSDAINVG